MKNGKILNSVFEQKNNDKIRVYTDRRTYRFDQQMTRTDRQHCIPRKVECKWYCNRNLERKRNKIIRLDGNSGISLIEISTHRQTNIYISVFVSNKIQQ